MRISNKDIPGIKWFNIDYANEPYFWYGTEAVDGTIPPWSEAPLSSLYLLQASGSVTLYAKLTDTDATADWIQLLHATGGQTIAGNLTVDGTLTAGDLVT